ncbi:N-acetyltransferase, NAT SF superfamily protein [Psychroflexus gondwanensis ACAM 44]|uniref:N-acetyltransferase, NAT SF superfamily protein n=1 Tax=Psychroflexus gondwanensis ACAM 44 TaxID=1189619 RepID=N1X3L8_9FLAO|nr:GNAT family N-acetyltransferase [Psychroflexus gondwanensis]EMY82678.1 N-acetyltransferase, NAT SF superfamily protein [Psychroflexus gondwanensis ACAM 44]
MVIFKKAHQKLYLDLRQSLKDLYLGTFTKGLSAQHISNEEAELYLDKLFTNGYGIFGFSDDQLVAALIVTSPSFDKERPESILNQFTDKDSLYIAEVLVDEEFRGLGLGKGLFKEFEIHLNTDIKHVLLRVWSKNEIAVNLYKKLGFEDCGSILQEKLKPVSKEPFEMHKLYMVKTY